MIEIYKLVHRGGFSHSYTRFSSLVLDLNFQFTELFQQEGEIGGGVGRGRGGGRWAGGNRLGF
jgi:hypothetical protein